MYLVSYFDHLGGRLAGKTRSVIIWRKEIFLYICSITKPFHFRLVQLLLNLFLVLTSTYQSPFRKTLILNFTVRVLSIEESDLVTIRTIGGL